VCWFLRKSAPDVTGRDAQVYRDFLRAGAEVALLAPRVLQKIQPDVVLELNGQFFAERIFNRYVAKGTNIVTYEVGWRTNTLGFDSLSEAGPINLDSSWDEAKQRRLTSREEEELDTWITKRAAGDMQRDFYIRFSVDKTSNPITALGLDPNLPTAVLFTNLVWDTAVLGRDLAFGSIKEWIVHTVRMFNEWPKRQLIIRIHPAEDLRPAMESSEKLADVVAALGPLPHNVRVVPARQQLSSYALMEHCQVGVVYTSTTGFEMALRRKPVIVAADVYYREKGFTYDVHQTEDYAALLNEAFNNQSLDNEQSILARRFAYLLLFRYLHKIPVVLQRPRDLPMFDPSEVDLLLPGALPEFDELIARLVTPGKDFVSGTS
jgi:hypothetical protein